MNIPTPQRTDVIQGVAAPTANEGAFQAPNQVAQNLAGVIGQGADILKQFSLKKQQAENVATLAEADRRMKEAYAQYEMEMQQSGDETEWAGKWQEQLSQLSGELMEKPMAPVVREALSQKYADYKSTTTIGVQQAVTQQSILRNKAQVERSVEYDLENGELDSAVEKVQAGVDSGLYSPLEAQKRIEGMEARIDYYDASMVTQEDP